MVLTAVSNGTITTDGTEQTIVSDAGENFKYHMIKVYTDAMVASDKITIKVYDWDVVAAAYKLFTTIPLQDVQTVGVVGYAPPLPQHRFKVTIQRTATGVGGDKAYNWERLSN